MLYSGARYWYKVQVPGTSTSCTLTAIGTAGRVLLCLVYKVQVLLTLGEQVQVLLLWQNVCACRQQELQYRCTVPVRDLFTLYSYDEDRSQSIPGTTVLWYYSTTRSRGLLHVKTFGLYTLAQNALNIMAMDADLENAVATETTPLMGNGTTDDRGIILGEDAPLGDIKEHTILERVVGAGAVVGRK